MITPDNIPAHAIKRNLLAHNGKRGVYYVWSVGVVQSYPLIACAWAWSAQGNCGEEPTQNLAMERARRWIRDGQ